MFQFAKKLTTLATRNASVMLRFQGARYFCNQNKISNPVHAKLRELYFKKGGVKNLQYAQLLSKTITEALNKNDYPEVLNLELLHLSLIKQSDGEKSDRYRNQIRQVARYCVARVEFNASAKLIQELRQIQLSIPEISPMQTFNTIYLQGYIYMQLNRLNESMKCYQDCSLMKHVQENPEIFFKICSEMARNHSRLGEREQALKKISKCEQILKVRQLDENSPNQMIEIHLQDLFHLAEIVSGMQERQLALKYIDMYKQNFQKWLDPRDPIYIESVQKQSKVYFNLKQFQKSIDLLNEAAQLWEEIGDQDPNYAENAFIMKNLAQTIRRQQLQK